MQIKNISATYILRKRNSMKEEKNNSFVLLENNQSITLYLVKKKKHHKCNCINKAICSLKGKRQYEWIVYKVGVYSCRPINSNVSCNHKKDYVGFTLGPFKKDITIIQVVLHSKYIDKELVYLTMCRILKII